MGKPSFFTLYLLYVYVCLTLVFIDLNIGSYFVRIHMGIHHHLMTNLLPSLKLTWSLKVFSHPKRKVVFQQSIFTFKLAVSFTKCIFLICF